MPQRILIAEDDELQGELLRAALSSRGYEAEMVTGGLEAVRRLRTRHYDLALLDYHMPEVDGLAAAQLLQDLVCEQDRPRLIAITAAAQGLAERQQVCGVPSFDAIVSKQIGLTALLDVVDANLATVAEHNAAGIIERGREAARLSMAARRRRWIAPLAAVPALVMAGAFAAAFGWAVASLQQVGGAAASAQHAALLSTDTAALVGAVADAEVSQRTYLATGAAAQRDLFESDAQHVDQLLVSSTSLTGEGAPGFGAGSKVPAIVELRLRTLADEARARGETAAAPILLDDGGHDAAEGLRGWAATVMSTSQQAMASGLQAVRGNIKLVLVVLAAGVVYGLWNAAMTVRRRWRAAGAVLGLRPLDARHQPGPRVSTQPLLHNG